MNNCMVSIVIPVYNGERYIRKCFESIVNLNYKNYEIIFIDDCSVDNSYKILEELKNNSNLKISLIKNRINSGVSYSRNIGIKRANGKYICFLDCDDTLDKDFLDILLKDEFCDFDIIMSGFNILFEDRIKKLSFNNTLEIKDDDIPTLISCMLNNIHFKDINPSLFGFSCGKLYNRKIIEDVEFDRKIHYREDTLFNIMILLKSKKILLLKDCKYNYLQNSNSASYRFFDNYLQEIEYYINKIFDVLNDQRFKKNIYVFGMYMYMSFLNHFAMHNSVPKLTQNEYIRMSFKCDLWNDIFRNVNLSMLPVHYKFLNFMFKFRSVLGIKILYYLNNIKKCSKKR